MTAEAVVVIAVSARTRARFLVIAASVRYHGVDWV
jgi:hypothetical protein